MAASQHGRHKPCKTKCDPATSCPPNLWSCLDGAQEVPPVETKARGWACIDLSDDFTTVLYIIKVEDLSSPITPVLLGGTGAHFHCGVKGVNGPILESIQFHKVHDAWWATGEWTVTPEEVVKIQTSGVYINVHTENYPGGEVRGQVYPCCFKNEFDCTCCPKFEVKGCGKSGSCGKKKPHHKGYRDDSDSEEEDGAGHGYGSYAPPPWCYGGGHGGCQGKSKHK